MNPSKDSLSQHPILWTIRSVPLFIKIMGIFAIVSLIFGMLLYYHIHHGALKRHHTDTLRKQSLYLGDVLAFSLTEPIITNRYAEILDTLSRIRLNHPEIFYLILRDPEGEVLAHTFSQNIPADLDQVFAKHIESQYNTSLLKSNNHLIFDSITPVIGGKAGWLQLGLTNADMKKELILLTEILAWIFLLSTILGGVMSFELTRRIVLPIKKLLTDMNRIDENTFGMQSPQISEDEIGELTEGFNALSTRLKVIHQEVQEKEARLKELVEKMLSLQEDERRAISRELHDEFGPSLSALNLTISKECRLGRLEKEACHDLHQQIQNLIDEVRKLAWQMRPSVLDDYGLDQALERLVQESNKISDINYDYQCIRFPDAKRPSEAIETNLYRITREALNNIDKHSKATEVSIQLTLSDERISLVIEDNGCGFDFNEVKERHGHIGLMSMNERMSLLGGKFSIDSALGQGTSLSFSIALPS